LPALDLPPGAASTVYLSIGEFSQRTRSSPKALRLYRELGLLLPVRVDPDSGYRFYREDQIEPARLVGLLPLKVMGWPALLPACDALERWTKENGREPAGALRQLLRHGRG